MLIAVTGFAFEDTTENGGEAVKIEFFRAQAVKMALKRQNTMATDAQGRRFATNEVLRRNGDTYMVDCNVTGTNEGTANDPLYPLEGCGSGTGETGGARWGL